MMGYLLMNLLAAADPDDASRYDSSGEPVPVHAHHHGDPAPLIQIPDHWPGQIDLVNWCSQMGPALAGLLIIAGVIYLLWGFKIFKTLMIINAIVVGAVIGAVVGDKFGAVVPVAVVGAVLGAAVADHEIRRRRQRGGVRDPARRNRLAQHRPGPEIRLVRRRHRPGDLRVALLHCLPRLRGHVHEPAGLGDAHPWVAGLDPEI